MLSTRAKDNIFELKCEGHELLEEYKVLARVGSKKAYETLKEKMRGKTWHFGSMNDVMTVKLAIGNLKKMIASKKYENSKMAV